MKVEWTRRKPAGGSVASALGDHAARPCRPAPMLMRTDDLVRLLAADARRTTPPRTSVLLAAIAGGALACLAFVNIIGVRPDLLSAMSDPRVAFKFAFAASVATAAVAYGFRAIEPDTRPSGLAFGLPVLNGRTSTSRLTPRKRSARFREDPLVWRAAPSLPEVGSPHSEFSMQVAPNMAESSAAVRTDLGAIFVSLELSRSKWMVTSLSPGQARDVEDRCSRWRCPGHARTLSSICSTKRRPGRGEASATGRSNELTKSTSSVQRSFTCTGVGARDHDPGLANVPRVLFWLPLRLPIA